MPGRSFIVVVTIGGLALAPAVSATESAVVGKLGADGRIQLFTNRFQPRFADRTAVAKIEATLADGFARVYRWSADGCRGESTLLKIGDAVVAEGPRPVIILTAHPLELTTCEDRGCADEFSDPGHTTAACGNIADLRCVCIRKNLTGDNIIVYPTGYCAKVWNSVRVWNLGDWIQTEFIQ